MGLCMFFKQCNKAFSQGVLAYRCAKIIGENAHESHYFFDVVNSNISEIEIAAALGDMNSY